MLLPEHQKKILYKINVVLSVFGFISFLLLILMTGFYLDNSVIDILTVFIDIQIGFFISQEIYRIWIQPEKLSYVKKRKWEIAFASFFLFYLLMPGVTMGFINWFFPMLRKQDMSIIYLSIAQLPILFLVGRKALKYSHLIGRMQLHPGAVFMISFALIILFGAFLLMLPKSAPLARPSVSFVDALFTSTSAVCVTGLTVIDTAKDYSTQGQIFILSLIQIGGLGVMTLTAMFTMFASGGISFQMRVMMGDILSEDSLTNVSTMIFRIIYYTLIIELICALGMYLSLGGTITAINPEYLYSAIFHSVSAFCNAGFSIYTENLMKPGIQNNYFFVSFIMLLIVLGGIGFSVMTNITGLKPFQRRQKRIRYQLSVGTKIVLITTSILIVLPAIIIYLFEPMTYLQGATEFDKFFHALFLSITTRTAGFNTIPSAMITGPIVLLVMLLMAIGASPGSTGGGIKTTTFALVAVAFFRMLRGKDRLTMFNREIHREYVRKALMIMFAYFLVFTVATFILAVMEKDKQIIDLGFEVVSALSTVGLSRDVSPKLGVGGKYLIIMVMFIGRISVLSFFMAFHKPKPEPNIKLPKTSVIIG